MRWVWGLMLVGTLAACGEVTPSQAPAVTAPTGITSASPTVVTPTPTPSVAPARHVFPVTGEVDYGHSHHDYPATDILTDCGNSYLAPYPGVILAVDRVDDWDPAVDAGATRGGRSITLLGDDGVRYYGSHFAAIDDDVVPGLRVAAGDHLATVGRSGDASACHVHFGLSPDCVIAGEWWLRRGVIWPWSYLDSWRAGGDASPVAEIDQWRATNGCPTAPTVDP